MNINAWGRSAFRQKGTVEDLMVFDKSSISISLKKTFQATKNIFFNSEGGEKT